MLKVTHKLIQISSIAVLILTIISFFGRQPYLELTTHFRLQYLLFSVVCAIALSFFKDWKLLIPPLICALINGVYIFPYYLPDNYQLKDVATINLRLMLANVEGRNNKYDKLLASVNSANPDILILQEVTQEWWQQVQILTEEYPHFKTIPRSGGGGLVLLSRFPLEQADVLTLDESTHLALFSKINLNDTNLSLLTIHPPTPMRKDKFKYRNEQFAQAASLIKAAPNPKVLIGDLNVTMWSPYFTDLTADSGLRDVRKGRGIYPSWNTQLPNFMRIPIDHCLVGEGIEVRDVKLGDHTGSDHFPLIVDLKVRKFPL